MKAIWAKKNSLSLLQLAAVAQVAGIAESRHDVFVLVHARVDGSAPYCCLVFGQSLFYVVYAVGRCYHAGNVYALGRALCQECPVAQLHRAAGGQHGVGNYERLAVDARRGKIFNVYAHLGVLAVGIFAVCAHEGVAGVYPTLFVYGSILEQLQPLHPTLLCPTSLLQ